MGKILRAAEDSRGRVEVEKLTGLRPKRCPFFPGWYTGVVLTEEEHDEIRRLTPSAKNWNAATVRPVRERLNAMAVAHGLPEGDFYYGLTFGGELTAPPHFHSDTTAALGPPKDSERTR